MKLLKFPVLLLAIPLLCSCGRPLHRKEIFAMDTVMSISAYGSRGGKLLEDAAQLIFELDSELDSTAPDSELSRLNSSGGGAISENMRIITEVSADVYKKTDGCFDITVAPLVKAWGFDKKEYRVPSADELSAALDKTGFDKISFEGGTISLNGTELDLGGIAKGYAAAKTAELLKDGGVSSAIMSLGGNVCAVGSKPDGSPWRVDIADPADTDAAVGTLNITDLSVVTSGIYQRNFSDASGFYHHILDPKTGKNPENDLASVSVIGADPTLCDALSTAFFVMGEEKAADYISEYGEAEAVFVYKDGSIAVTSGLNDIFETDRQIRIIS